jgi:DNA-binding CsgD family transcriptional regulator/tetratricopeptide (TPR) repeat protein
VRAHTDPVAGLRCPRFVGRERELRELLAGVDAACEARGRAIGVVGVAGIGKSRLLAELTARVPAGVSVLVGRCVGDGPPVALRPLAEALLGGLRTSGHPITPELEPFLPALGRVLPQWRTLPRPVENSAVILGEGVLRLLRAVVGERAVVLALEDLHWADPDTLAVVEYLADNVRDQRLFLLATTRDEAGPARSTWRTLVGRGSVRELRLPALDADAATVMAVACVGGTPGRPLLDLVRSRAEGVPLLIEELVAAGLDAPGEMVVPTSVAEATAAKLASLPGTERYCVRVAAVLGERFDWGVLAAVVGLEPEAAFAAMRRAIAAELITVADDGRFAFRHALTRDAVLEAMLPPERARLAGAALAAVRRAQPSMDGPWSAVAIGLALLAGEGTTAASLLLGQGRRDLENGSLATAEAALRRARQLVTDHAAVLAIDEVLAEVLLRAGRPVQAAAVTSSLLDGQRRRNDLPSRLASTQLRLARAWADAGEWGQAAAQAHAARRHATDPDLTVQADLVEALVAFGQEHFDRAQQLASAVLEHSERSGPADLACESLELLGRLARRHDLPAAERLFDRALRIAEIHELPVRRLRALHELSTTDLLDSLRCERAERAHVEAVRCGAVGLATYADFHRGAMHCWRGDLDEARALLATCERSCRALRLPVLPMVLVHQAMIEVLVNDDPGATCAEARVLAAGDPHVEAAVRHVEAVRLLLAEDRAGALAVLDPAMDSYRARLETTSGPPLALWTLLATLERGEVVLRQVAALPGARVARWTVGHLGYAEAVTLGRAARGAAAATAFAAAEHVMAHPLPMPHLCALARRQVAEAALADGWGDPVSWLRDDADHFHRSGHHTVAAACRGLLRRAGARVPRRMPGPEVPPALRRRGVTAREMDVLLLVAQGMPNRDIARRMVLSPRTVEKHVERLLAKTGATGRTQLATRTVADDW